MTPGGGSVKVSCKVHHVCQTGFWGEFYDARSPQVSTREIPLAVHLGLRWRRWRICPRRTAAAEPAAGADAVTVNWSCAGVADVYINGKPLRDYKPDFLSREDEPAYEYHASASLKVGDVITVGAKKGKVAGFRLAVFNAKNQVVWQSETSNWRSYAVNPRVAKRWYLPATAMRSRLGSGHRGGQGVSAAGGSSRRRRPTWPTRSGTRMPTRCFWPAKSRPGGTWCGCR